MADETDTTDAPLSTDEQAMLDKLLARKAAAEAKAARDTALEQLDGVEGALGTMMSATCLGALRTAAGKTWDQNTLQQLNRIVGILNVDGPALLATIAALKADPDELAPTA